MYYVPVHILAKLVSCLYSSLKLSQILEICPRCGLQLDIPLSSGPCKSTVLLLHRQRLTRTFGVPKLHLFPPSVTGSRRTKRHYRSYQVWQRRWDMWFFSYHFLSQLLQDSWVRRFCMVDMQSFVILPFELIIGSEYFRERTLHFALHLLHLSRSQLKLNSNKTSKFTITSYYFGVLCDRLPWTSC